MVYNLFVVFSLAHYPTTTTLDCYHIRTIDGDTFVANVFLPLDVVLNNQRIRIKNFNAPELSVPEGLKYKDKLDQLLSNADRIIIEYDTKKPRDKYGRLLCDVFVEINGQKWNVTDLILQETNNETHFEIFSCDN